MMLVSPLAEGRELKWLMVLVGWSADGSPLAEGRELKWLMVLVG